MEFQGFSKESLSFLSEIRNNNNKEWFEAHRDRYEKYILDPSRAFVIEMGEHLQALEPTIHAEPKINKSLYKIYRDIRRMGANKAPIKSKIGFIFWQGNSKRMQSSSFYMHFSPDELFVAVGVRWFEKPMLDAFRQYIKNDAKRAELAHILEEITGLNRGYRVIEKGYKRYPKGFDKEMEHADLSLYKGMATYKILDPELIIDGEALIETLYEIYEDMFALQSFMYEVSLRVQEV